ncbi:uncharacterized protein BO66DRAFT_434086 [Aspergillus aculeatinus CBS 121060]|uniref:Uncharacterized protein n=1 Tax=Aspergillus aculeatinus CBS 121060 TaxID=1448322 RepID=A0ACD1HNI4_9EURO|nr:hypothetical protein BO66DRAFT_434086 [Aspergillus aculeatinus CBS 121060]RAH74980.1 hypothetical protein BO66DRAFT_434086 [Aspergillus aculeatinus CBS 121060]
MRQQSPRLSGRRLHWFFCSLAHEDGLANRLRERLAQLDHGFTYYQLHMRTDTSQMPFISDVARYFVASRNKSPPRIIFFCRWPLTQRVLAMFLQMLGIGICQMWAYQSPEERGNVAATFTSKDSGAEVLVATYRLASVGLNL